MKYEREKHTRNQNIKRNHTKKHQHNMKIISFLKSNYKYKRRCTIGGCYPRRQQMEHVRRQQQTHPLPAGDIAMSDHRNMTRIFLCKTTKASKFPRIFITIMQPAAQAAPAPTPPATNSNVSVWVRPLMWRIKGADVASRAPAVCHLSNAYKDANKDTDTAYDGSSSNGKEIHYQHGNYDKVSTITSTQPLSSHRQKYNQIKLSPSTAKLLSLPPTQLLQLPLVCPHGETGRCFETLRHNINCDDGDGDDDDDDDGDDEDDVDISGNYVKTTKSFVSILWDSYINSRNCCRTTNSSNRNNCTLKTHINPTCCQSADQYVNVVTCNRSYTLPLLLTLFIAFAIGVRTTSAGACWQTVLGSGKCNDIFSFNMSKSECCGANQEFAYTDREPTSVEYFFATAIGGGMECTPCLESCRNVRCGPNKKCVKRKGRPKCVCSPECGATRRRRIQREQQIIQQHHSAHMAERDDASEDDRDDSYDFNTMRERLRQSRDTRSLSSEITKKQLNIGPEKQPQNQRKYIHIHMQEDYAHQQEAPPPKRKNQQPKGNRRLVLTTNVEHAEKPTTRRIQLFSNVRTTFARRHFGKNNNAYNGQHEDTDLTDDYGEESIYDEEQPDALAGAGNKKSNGNSDNNRNDDATRFVNQSLSRHKPKTNKNRHDHDLQATKTQQREQYSGNGNNSHSRQSEPNGRHAENTSSRHRPHRHRHRHRHHHTHAQELDHHRHEHNQRFNQDLHHQHHNDRQLNRNHNQNENLGRRKHNKQQQRPNVLKHPKNLMDYNSTTSITTNSISSSTIDNSVTHSNTASVLNSPSTATDLSTNTQTQLLLQPPTTPVNSTAFTGVASDAIRYTNHGSKIATSSSLPSSIAIPPSPTSPSSSSSLLSAASTHSYMQSAAVTMSAAASTSTHNGGGVTHQPQHRDRNDRPKATPPIVAASTTGNYNNDNDNTISSLQLSTYHQGQQHGGVIIDSFFDQFDLHGFPKSQHEHDVTITDSIRPSNPVCGTDGRTYNTECQLRKRACRTDNPNLQIAYRGHCKTTCNGVKCMNGLTCVEDQYMMPHCIACKIHCPLDDYDNGNDIRDANRAVCGADGKTYKSMCDINRIICKIGRSIGVAYLGPCRGNQITCDDINCGSKQICLIDLMTHQPRCTPCRYKCSRKRRPTSLRFEEDMVCGVNNRTYNSWCEMRKDSCSTGYYIEVKYPGHCH